MSESAPPVQTRKRCMVYVDAFNWYFGVFIHRPAWKWLNLGFHGAWPHRMCWS
jgi:hypothetical protein